jgi:hypothetical protein
MCKRQRSVQRTVDKWNQTAIRQIQVAKVRDLSTPSMSLSKGFPSILALCESGPRVAQCRADTTSIGNTNANCDYRHCSHSVGLSGQSGLEHESRGAVLARDLGTWALGSCRRVARTSGVHSNRQDRVVCSDSGTNPAERVHGYIRSSLREFPHPTAGSSRTFDCERRGHTNQLPYISSGVRHQALDDARLRNPLKSLSSASYELLSCAA